MNIRAGLIYAILIVSAIGTPVIMPHLLQKRAVAVKKQVQPEETMEQWIARVNAKKIKCDGQDGDSLGGGGNGHNSWELHCVGGVQVYRDTTKEMQERMREERIHKSILANALVSRVLTDSELREVGQHGSQLLIEPMVSYNAQDIEARFQSMMAIQQAFRAGKRCAQ